MDARVDADADALPNSDTDGDSDFGSGFDLDYGGFDFDYGGPGYRDVGDFSDWSFDSDVPLQEHALPAVRYGGCDLCGEALGKEDVYLGLVGNPSGDGDSTKFHSVAGPFKAGHPPAHDYNGRIEHTQKELGIVCSNRQPCQQCQEAPEAIAIHRHCLHLLVRHCRSTKDAVPDSLFDFVWATSAWRSPWRDTLYLCLDNTRSLPVLPPASYLSKLGLQGLAKLPSELVHLVHNESCRSLFWGYANVLDMASRYTRATSLPADELVTVSLSRVSSWRRGHAPVLADEPCGTGSIRLTIDSAGMQSIERLDHNTLYGFHASTPRFDDLAFAVFDAAAYPEAKVHFKYGLARLSLPRGARHPDIWDTPLPPNLEPVPGFSFKSWRFQTADLDKVTALSFLSRDQRLVAIHRHTAKEPSAASTVERMAPWIARPDMWEYLATSEIRRHISAMPGLVTDTERSLGSPVNVLRIFTLPGGGALPTPSRLIWGYHMPNVDSICVVATTTRDPKGKEQDTVRHPLSPIYKDDNFGGRLRVLYDYQHSAPLDGAIRVQVFNSQHGKCEGIILDYADGSQKAVGSCRTGVIVPVTTWMPARIHIRREVFVFPSEDSPSRYPQAAVAFSSNRDSFPDQGTFATPWESWEMAGRLSFQTSSTSDRHEIEPQPIVGILLDRPSDYESPRESDSDEEG